VDELRVWLQREERVWQPRHVELVDGRARLDEKVRATAAARERFERDGLEADARELRAAEEAEAVEKLRVERLERREAEARAHVERARERLGFAEREIAGRERRAAWVERRRELVADAEIRVRERSGSLGRVSARS
jgi:hypothetical protein